MPETGSKFTASDLKPGKSYQVAAEFEEYDGLVRPVGETWKFKEKHSLPYEDRLTLILEKDGQEVWVHLQWRQETRGELIDDFSSFVQEI